jgi:heat-inducible transcriptional repressor
MPDARVSPRERLVLTAIIELYIATGEPVASQAVARIFCRPRRLEFGHHAQRDGHAGRGRPAGAAAHLGRPGSHRRGLPLLRRADYPAAGRMAAGRATVQPGRCRKARPHWGRRPERSPPRQIEESFSGVASTNDYLERTSHVLALLSSGLGVALASSTAGQVLEHIHFSRLSTGRVLAVLVTQAGAVQDRVLAWTAN